MSMKKRLSFTNIFNTCSTNISQKKTVTMTNLDKYWMTPELKQLLRQAQRTRVAEGRSPKFKKLWSKFRKLKRAKISSFRNKMVKELKEGDSGQ